MEPPPHEAVRAFTVVFVEDDTRLAQLTARYLESHGVLVHHFSDGPRALAELSRLRPDVVLLDWLLPGGFDGAEVCARIRERSDVPVVMLTARDGELDKVRGLDVGADDYVTKPFSAPELLARLRAQARRARGLLVPPSPPPALGPLRLDLPSRTATLHGRPLALTTYEFDLLAAMAARPGHVLSRERLMELATGTAEESFDRAVDVHVSHLRQKLGDDARAPRWIKTVRGVGYLLTAPGDEP